MLALHPESLLGQLAHLPDPRRRSGRRYPIAALLGMVIIGMLNGQDSLHSAWLWAEKRWGQLWEPLGAHSPHFPAYNTLRELISRLDADEVDRLLRPWMERFLGHPLGGISADGKVLRGSKRATTPALHVVELVSQAHGEVLAQREAVGGDEVAALLVLLTEVPLAGRTSSMDAGLLTAGVTQMIQQEQGHERRQCQRQPGRGASPARRLGRAAGSFPPQQDQPRHCQSQKEKLPRHAASTSTRVSAGRFDHDERRMPRRLKSHADGWRSVNCGRWRRANWERIWPTSTAGRRLPRSAGCGVGVNGARVRCGQSKK